MISVVIPAFNAARTIERAICSVLNQTVEEELEIIVVDDGSTDDTGRLAEAFGAPVRLIVQDNAGPGAARNRGIDQSVGEWVAFLDADDEWRPTKLRQQLELLRANPAVRWCASNFVSRGDSGERLRIPTAVVRRATGRSGVADNYLRQAAARRLHAATPTVVVHREVLDAVGCFTTEWMWAEDTDLWWRIAHRYPRIGFVAAPLVTVHLDDASSVRNRQRLESKRGIVERQLVREHLKLAAAAGSADDFRRLARTRLRKSLQMMLYHGHGDDALETIGEFPDLVGRDYRAAVAVLGRIPRLSAPALRLVARLLRGIGLERESGRRW